MPETPSVDHTVRVRLPWATEVFLVGEFNHWSTVTTPMKHVGDGVFETHLPAGTTLGRFCFYVLGDGISAGKIIHHELDFEPMVG